MKFNPGTRTQSRLVNLVMLVLILLLAALLAWLSARYEWQYDWTRSGRHTLSEASRQTLERMDGPIRITVYAREDASLREAIKQFIGRYQRARKDIKLNFVNPDIVPDEVRRLGVTAVNEMVIYYGNKSQHVQPGSEEEMTNALQRLARETEQWLAFSEGHGERDPLGDANFDLGEWGHQLKNRGMKIQPVNMAEIKAVPGNTQVLVIADPSVDYLPGEIELISDYIATGGNLLWLVEPDSVPKGLEQLAGQLQIGIEPGMVIDFAGRLIGLDDPTIVLETTSLYPPHPVTDDFNYTTLFPGATAITTGTTTDWSARPLIVTGDHTWQEISVESGEASYDEGKDRPGPLHIGVSLEREIENRTSAGAGHKKQRVVVIGDADFLANTYIANSGNLELGIRIINWLGNEDDFISIPARIAEDTVLELTPLMAAIIGFGFLLIVPGLLVMTGILLWWRRRKL